MRKYLSLLVIAALFAAAFFFNSRSITPWTLNSLVLSPRSSPSPVKATPRPTPVQPPATPAPIPFDIDALAAMPNRPRDVTLDVAGGRLVITSHYHFVVYLKSGGRVDLDGNNGTVLYIGDVNQDEAALVFWRALAQMMQSR